MAGEDKRYIRWLHTQPCACHPCAAAPQFIQAHHPRSGVTGDRGNGRHLGRRPGMGQRSSDVEAFSLCDKHHAQVTAFPTKGDFEGWTKEELRAWEQAMSKKYREAYEADLAAKGEEPSTSSGAVPVPAADDFEPRVAAAEFCSVYELSPQIEHDLVRLLDVAIKATQEGRV